MLKHKEEDNNNMKRSDLFNISCPMCIWHRRTVMQYWYIDKVNLLLNITVTNYFSVKKIEVAFHSQCIIHYLLL